MKSIYRYILFLYIFLSTLPQLYAFQDTFRSISVSDGLEDLVVNSIYKDKRGFIWIGTNSSVERFDGIRLKKYSLSRDGSIAKRIYDICESGENRLYCGTGDGLHMLDTISDQFVRIFPDKINFKVNNIFPFSSDSLLLTTDKGLYLSTADTVICCTLEGHTFTTRNVPTSIARDHNSDAVWISTKEGLIYYEPYSNKSTVFNCNDVNLSNSFYNISIIGDYVYLGTMNKGLMRFNIKKREFSSFVDVGCSVISSLSSDGKDILYVGTDGNGVHFVSISQNKIIKSYRHVAGNSEGIRSNSVYSVLVDRDGLLWVGLYQMGVDYTPYQSGLFGVYKWKDKFTSKDMSVRTIAFDGKRKLIGSRDGLVIIDEDRDIVKYYNIPSIRSNMIISSCFFDGKFYIGTYGGGMYVINPEDLSIHDFPDTNKEPFKTGHIFCIRPDNSGNLWVGTSDGLFCFNGGKMIYHFTSSQSKLPPGNVYEIFFDSSDNGWVCAEKGICLWEASTKSIIIDSFPKGFVSHEKIRAIYETSGHDLYFLPEKGPMFYSDIPMKKFSYVDSIPMLEGKQFLSIIEDDMDGMLVTTNNGMYRLSSDGNVMPFSFADGIPSPIFINCTSVRDSDGGLWFGNSKGLVFLKSGDINSLRKHHYNVEITNILANGVSSGVRLEKSNESEYNLYIDGSKRNITVQFSGLIYTDPSNMIYEYSLGENGEWRTLHGLSEISLYEVVDNSILKVRRAGYPEAQAILYINVDKDNSVLLYLIIILGVLFITLYLFRKRVVKYTIGNLKKFISWLQHEEKEEDNNNEVEIPVETEIEDHAMIEETDKYKTNRLTDEECKRLLKLLDKEMTKNKLYVNPSLKIADLANVANTSSHALSYLFNQYLQKSYYDYINEFRVEEFKNIIQQKKYSQYTLEALSEHCGFSSRASFFRSFKKVTGITPNEYIKNIKGESRSK
ncbi:helix-turn-helix domain-containing protein [Bacteroides caecigallinarum]|uniref:two-component regulator propeller domain-containing protein n=1 Tax=Bacteroides caecigallinarum TaxID=1411144 RepID=UPI00195E7E16|nr:two-component regulator propeller domain-containing protein [Bacteroides caecigallinarum]MBM6962087.1 helix-turn-helix domain-containing protein [Bacteroides caecigallinarum]